MTFDYLAGIYDNDSNNNNNIITSHRGTVFEHKRNHRSKTPRLIHILIVKKQKWINRSSPRSETSEFPVDSNRSISDTTTRTSHCDLPYAYKMMYPQRHGTNFGDFNNVPSGQLVIGALENRCGSEARRRKCRWKPSSSVKEEQHSYHGTNHSNGNRKTFTKAHVFIYSRIIWDFVTIPTNPSGRKNFTGLIIVIKTN
jgi:hypothetical protein